MKLITSPANFAARPQDTRPKDVRFLRNMIGVTWAGPGQVHVMLVRAALEAGASSRSGLQSRQSARESGKVANAVVFISTAPVDPIFESEDKTV